ncbi:hypothetical protein J3R30DRAFT_2596562 [Lentinula aciculospora]|uniref:VWFA domain-containing protein n=1 Tax=Lentinula aciculospora TaxID=153920 RepID=A0A9W9AEB4_9AGAR|nr:hypothetical protein J3R30DRAFT_2596562 [Lentinula aciculospora]
MRANYGGTEMAGALDAVFASLALRLTRPVSIFLLTDGGVWGTILQNCVTKVEKVIADRTSDKAFLRVFTVGIGNGVSTETCDRIARAGGGTSTYIVADNEQFIGKCTRLVRAARTPPIVDIKVTWVTPQQNSQHDATGQTINLFDPANTDYDECEVGPLAPIMQAPDIIPSFYRSTRTDVYAIVPNSIAISRELKVTGRIPLTGASVELKVPIQRFAPFPGGAAFMHTLAAKSLIQDHEDDEQGGGGDKTALQAEITSLGIAYKLTSRYTSLLAVDRRNRDVLGMNNQLGASSNQSVKGAVPTPVALRSLSMNLFAAPSVPDTAEALILLARLQKFDGGFDASSVFEIESALDASGGSGESHALEIVKTFIPNTEPELHPEKIQAIYATLLAWAYMSIKCKEDGYDMKEKANAWLRENLENVDVDELERQFLDAVGFEIDTPGNEVTGLDSDSDSDLELEVE